MKKIILLILLAVMPFIAAKDIFAANKLTPTESVKVATNEAETATASALVVVEPTAIPRPDLTEQSKESVEPLKRLLDEQKVGSAFPLNPIKYAIRSAVNSGVPPNTIVLLLLLPGVAALIASARHLIGLRGFGIFLPAALSVVFMATGPIIGIALFMIIVAVSTITRITMRKLKVKLQYLPRMALLLHFVVLGILAVLFTAPHLGITDFSKVSIFPVLILVLLAEDFTRVQLGKSAKVAINLASETLLLALISFIFLNLQFVQEFALLKPEVWIMAIIILDIVLGRYIGLRLMEYWRFRKLIQN